MSGLTTKECQVVHLIAAGRISKEIAQELGIAEETVDDRVERAMRRLGVRTRAQLAAVYARLAHTRKVGRSRIAPGQLLLTA